MVKLHRRERGHWSRGVRYNQTFDLEPVSVREVAALTRLGGHENINRLIGIAQLSIGTLLAHAHGQPGRRSPCLERGSLEHFRASHGSNASLTALVLEGLAGFDLSQLLHPLHAESGDALRCCLRWRPAPGTPREVARASGIFNESRGRARGGSQGSSSSEGGDGGGSALWDALVGLARGLAFAHSHSVVHGDVHPGNLRLVPRVSGAGRGVLFDFSEALVCDDVPTGGGGGGDKRAPVMAMADVYHFGRLLRAICYQRSTGPAPIQQLERLLRLPRGSPSECEPLQRQPPDLVAALLNSSATDAHDVGVDDLYRCAEPVQPLMDELIEVCSTAPRQMAEGVAHVQRRAAAGFRFSWEAAIARLERMRRISPQSPLAWGCAGLTTLRAQGLDG